MMGEHQNLSELAELWIASRSYRPASAKQRRCLLRRFVATVGTGPPEALSGFDILAWWASTEGLSPETRRAHHSTVAGFLRWCRAMGFEVPATLDEVRRPPVPRTVPKVLTVDQERALRAGVAGTDLELAVALMLDMGLRRSEVTRACVADVADGWLAVSGKGGHRDQVPLHPNVARLVPESGPMVRWGAGHLSTLVTDAMHAAGIHGHTCHSLRRTFATRLMESGTPAVDVMRLLRHRSLATTTAYVASRFDYAA